MSVEPGKSLWDIHWDDAEEVAALRAEVEAESAGEPGSEPEYADAQWAAALAQLGVTEPSPAP